MVKADFLNKGDKVALIAPITTLIPVKGIIPLLPRHNFVGFKKVYKVNRRDKTVQVGDKMYPEYMLRPKGSKVFINDFGYIGFKNWKDFKKGRNSIVCINGTTSLLSRSQVLIWHDSVF